MLPANNMHRFLILALLFLSIATQGISLKGRIVRVISGDEILFQTSDSSFTVHLYGIDAPDMGQVFGTQAIDYLETFLWAEARIEIIRNINQKGISALLLIKGKNINHEMIKNGYAWYNRIHCINAEFAYAEQHARNKKLGLWIDEYPVAPWNFRSGVLAKPPPTDGIRRVLICADQKDIHYHRDYCKDLLLCHDNVIVILRKQAKSIKMKPCRHCF
jgi:micrococcal nuclease